MKRIISIFSVLFIFSCTTNENTELPGVKFEQLTFTETLAKAQKENKTVMIDVYSYN